MSHSVRGHYRRDYIRRDGTYVSATSVRDHWRGDDSMMSYVGNGPWVEDNMEPTLQFTRDCARHGDVWAIRALCERGEPVPAFVPRVVVPDPHAEHSRRVADEEAERSRQFTRDCAAAGDAWAIEALIARGEAVPAFVPRIVVSDPHTEHAQRLAAEQGELSRQFTRDRAAAGDAWAIQALRERGE